VRFDGKKNVFEFAGRPSHERVQWCVMQQMMAGEPFRKVTLSPETWQTVLQLLVGSRDPTLRAEWEGPRCYMRLAIAGREVVIHSDEKLAADDIEVGE
jgi:hypothetical protein